MAEDFKKPTKILSLAFFCLFFSNAAIFDGNANEAASNNGKCHTAVFEDITASY